MKVITLAFLLAGSGMAYGQAPAPEAPNPPPGLFHFSPAPEDPGQRFKLRIPDEQGLFQSPPGLQKAPWPGKGSNLDSGILRRPQGFAQHAPRSPLSRNLYPDLKVLPIEIASAASDRGSLPPPGLEPIPTTWDEFRVAPVREAAAGPK